VFVVHWDKTRRDAVESALKDLERFAARLAGVVLNHVDLKRHARFSYGDAGQYYARYRAYYRD
jgi:Mrp family chromosome partitioning ATPase